VTRKRANESVPEGGRDTCKTCHDHGQETGEEAEAAVTARYGESASRGLEKKKMRGGTGTGFYSTVMRKKEPDEGTDGWLRRRGGKED